MSAIFLKIINMSITASWLILAVILVRFVLKKAPKWVRCLLWALVAIRLLCPFSFESVFSLVPSSETIPRDIGISHEPAINSGISIVNNTINPIIADSFTPKVGDSINPLQAMIPAAAAVWIIGVLALLAYALISYLKLKRSVAVAAPLGDKIMVCDEVKSPFILGILRPLVYVPSSMSGEILENVIRHEKAHLKRRDHLWKPLGFLLLAVYWFNPLSWIAYILLCRDIEMACDERVIRDMNRDDIAAYSQALLDCSFSRRQIAACPLAFGEVGVKERVKGVLNYKRPAFWIILIAVILCVFVAVCLMTNPPTNKNTPTESGESIVDGEDIVMGNMKTYSFLPDETYECDGYSYKYRLELVGRMHAAAVDSKYVVLSNREDITFEQAAATLFSSDSNDWFDPKEAVLVDISTLENISATSQVASSGWMADSGSIYHDAVTPVPVVSIARYLPVVVLDTKEELNQFKKKYANIFELGHAFEEAVPFSDAIAAYDETFFDTHTLVLICIYSNKSELRYTLQNVTREESGADGAIYLNVVESSTATTTEDEELGWFVMTEIKDEDLAGVTKYYSKIVRDGVAEDATITFTPESEIDPEPVTYENKEWADEFNDIFDAIINDESLFEIDSLENINDVYMRVGDRVIAYMNPDTYWEFKYDKVAYYVELHNAVHNEEKYVLLDVDSELGKRLSELAALLMGE